MLYEKSYYERKLKEDLLPIKKRSSKKGWLIKIFLVLFLVVTPFFYFFTYIDISESCGIFILPSLIEASNLTIKKAITIVKNYSPQDYKNLCKYVSTISPNLGCGGFEGGCYYDSERGVIYISTSNRNLVNAPPIIVHEVCHVMQAAQKRPFDESECYHKDTVFWKGMVQY